MSIVIELPPEKERELADRAQGRGQDIASYVGALIDRDIQSPPTIDELLAPIRRQFAGSGMTEVELDELIDEARHEVWQ